MDIRSVLTSEVQELVDLLELQSIELHMLNVQGEPYTCGVLLAQMNWSFERFNVYSGKIHTFLVKYPTGKIAVDIRQDRCNVSEEANLAFEDDNKRALLEEIVTRILHTVKLFFTDEYIAKAIGSSGFGRLNINPDPLESFRMSIDPKSYSSVSINMKYSRRFEFYAEHDSIWKTLMGKGKWNSFTFIDYSQEEDIYYKKSEYKQICLDKLNKYNERNPSMVIRESMVDEHIRVMENLRDYMHILENIKFYS